MNRLVSAAAGLLGIVLVAAACQRPRGAGVVCYALERGSWDRAAGSVPAGEASQVLRLLAEPAPGRDSSVPPSALLALVGRDSASWWTPTVDSLVVAVAAPGRGAIHLGGGRARRSGTMQALEASAPVTATRVACPE